MSDDGTLSPDDFLANVETDGGNAMQAPPGFKLVPLHEAGIFFPHTARHGQPLRLARGTIEWNNGQPSFNPNGETSADFNLRRRLYNSTRIAVPSDDALGFAAWEAQADELPSYQRECAEVEWIKNPESMPPHERFTLRWRKVRDELGVWWVTPSGKIMLNAAYYIPPAPQAPLAPIVEKIQDRGELVYKPLRRGS